MKILSIISLILSACSFGACLFLHFVVMPAKEIAQNTVFSNMPESWYGSAEHHRNLDIMEFGTTFAIIVMFMGILTFTLSLIPAIKKQKIAWIGVGLSLVATFMGIIYGTHMFS